MDLEVISFAKFKILYINVFVILYKAATLNVYKLVLDLREVDSILRKTSDVQLFLTSILLFLITLLIMAKFVFGYLSLAANVVAIFPILSEDQPELLLPTMLAQAIENIFLSTIELTLGYLTIKYFIPGKLSVFVIFAIKILIKMSLSISVLNMYSDLYHNIKYPNEKSKTSLIKAVSSEELVKCENLD